MKKIKRTIIGTLFTLLIVSSSIVPALAETDNPNRKGSSKVTVKFKAPDSTEPVLPVDPTNPENPLPPEGGDGNNMNAVGPLTVDYVPNFTFEEIDIGTDVKTFNSKSMLPYVQVSDRRHTGEGWTLTASMSELTNSARNHEISDFKLILDNGKTIKGFEALKPNREDAPNLAQTIELTPVGQTAIMTATPEFEGELNKGIGMGTWLAAWLDTNETTTKINENVRLIIDAKDAREGTYESTINWTLAPQQP